MLSLKRISASDTKKKRRRASRCSTKSTWVYLTLAGLATAISTAASLVLILAFFLPFSSLSGSCSPAHVAKALFWKDFLVAKRRRPFLARLKDSAAEARSSFPWGATATTRTTPVDDFDGANEKNDEEVEESFFEESGDDVAEIYGIKQLTSSDYEDQEEESDGSPEWGLLSRLLLNSNNSSDRGNTTKQKYTHALKEHLRTSLNEWASVNRTTSNSSMTMPWTGLDLLGAVSTTATSVDKQHIHHRVDKEGNIVPSALKFLSRGGSTSIDSLGVLDRLARILVVNLGKLVVLQSLMTSLKAREVFVLHELADKLLSEESATAVKTIRGILTSVGEHGVVDVFNQYSSQDIAASFYALHRLQRVAQHYATFHIPNSQQESQQHPPDLLHVLEDLSHYAIYASAAYGWKMDLAFQGKLHLGDEQALIRKTGIHKEDILLTNFKSKANLPVFFLVRDRQQKTLVLCIRGTWSARDVLTDLCCTVDEYGREEEGESDNTTSLTSLSSLWAKWVKGNTSTTSGARFFAHHGMREAAMAVALEVEEMIEEALHNNPEYSLVLVGHSLGGGVAALLTTLWDQKFPNIKAYLYGGPCVAPIYSHPTNHSSIINVIIEGDPFRCLSLGHIADISAAVARFCQEPELRRTVLMKTDTSLDDMCEEDMQYCLKTMERIRAENMTNPHKMFPPGRIFHVSKVVPDRKHNRQGFGRKLTRGGNSEGSETAVRSESDLKSNEVVIHEVKPQVFKEFIICARMFDVSKHLPSLYETTLRKLIDLENEHEYEHNRH